MILPFRRVPRCRVCRRRADAGVRLYPVTVVVEGRTVLSARCYDCLDVESRYGPA